MSSPAAPACRTPAPGAASPRATRHRRAEPGGHRGSGALEPRPDRRPRPLNDFVSFCMGRLAAPRRYDQSKSITQHVSRSRPSLRFDQSASQNDSSASRNGQAAPARTTEAPARRQRASRNCFWAGTAATDPLRGPSRTRARASDAAGTARAAVASCRSGCTRRQEGRCTVEPPSRAGAVPALRGIIPAARKNCSRQRWHGQLGPRGSRAKTTVAKALETVPGRATAAAAGAMRR